MAEGRFFRGANLYLVAAGLLGGALLLAPMAYASNYSTGLHATIYGLWVTMDQSLGHGMNVQSQKPLWELPIHFPYAVLGVLCFGMAIVVAFVNGNQDKKQIWIGRTLMVAFAYMLAGMLLRYSATGQVGDSSPANSLDAGFQREFMLHFFVIYFVWRAWRKQSKLLKA